MSEAMPPIMPPSLVRRLNVDFTARIKEGVAFAFGPPAIPGLGTGSGFTMMLQDRGGQFS